MTAPSGSSWRSSVSSVDSIEVEVASLLFTVHEGVAPITEGTRLLAAVMNIEPGQRVLDLGAGCGVHSVLAARRGAHVIATDVVSACLDCARANANRHGIADRIDFRPGSLYEPVAGERFHVILATPPQLPGRATGGCSFMAEADDNGRAVLDAIIAGARAHLEDDGRLFLLQFAFLGVQRTLDAGARAGLEARVLAERMTRSSSASARWPELRTMGLTQGVEEYEGELQFQRVVIEARRESDTM